MKPPQVPGLFNSPITDPKSGVVSVGFMKWFQAFFAIDPLYNIVIVVSGTYTALETDEVIIVNTAGGAGTVNLPASIGNLFDTKLNRSKVYVIKASGGSNVTVQGNGQNIDGAASTTVNSGTSKRFVNDGTQWYAID